jgi:hypothetical protein
MLHREHEIDFLAERFPHMGQPLRKKRLERMTCTDNAACTDVNLHHSKFIALRDDKPVKDLRREQPVG